MATVLTGGLLGSGTANLGTAQTGNVVSTNIADRGSKVGPALLRIITTVGATPTCTYLIEGSADGSNWFAAPYALPATPETVAVAAIVISSATTTLVLLRPFHAWRYLRVTMSSNTNVTSTLDVYAP